MEHSEKCFWLLLQTQDYTYVQPSVYVHVWMAYVHIGIYVYTNITFLLQGWMKTKDTVTQIMNHANNNQILLNYYFTVTTNGKYVLWYIYVGM